MSDLTVKLQEMIDKGNEMFVKLNSFKDKNSAFSYYFPQGKTLNGVVQHLDTVTKSEGEKTALILINANLAFRFRGKANSMLKDDAENLKRIKEDNTLLITPEDAMTYEPGTREASTEAGFLRAKTDALKQASEFKKKGDMVNYKIWATKAIECHNKLTELAAAAMAELDNVVLD